MKRLTVALLVVAMAACKPSGKDTNGSSSPDKSQKASATPWEFIETGDLAALEKHGKIRILLPRQGDGPYLPRQGFPLDIERQTAEEFAESLGLEPLWVYVDNRGDLINWLLEGKGDVIAANLTVTDERKKRVAFTVPVARVREQLVTRKDDTIQKAADLAGRKVVVRKSSSYWGTIEALQKKYPTIELVEAPDDLDTEQIIHRVAEGDYDTTVCDDNLTAAVLTYRDDVRPAVDLTEPRAVAWALRPEAKELRKQLDTFLNQAKLARRKQSIYKEDLSGLKKRKVLRVLTRNSGATYFLYRGELLGFEYELAQQFANEHGMKVELVVPPSRDLLLPWLKEGRGDIVAAALTVTEARKKDPELAWSRPYSYVSEIVVKRVDDELDKKEQLEGRTIVVRKSSSYWETLTKLKEAGLKFKLEAAPEDMETEEIIGKVADGTYDLTVSDSHILDIELTWRDDVDAAFPLGEPVSHGWAMRAGDEELLAAVNSFFDEEYRGLFYNLAYKKYFKNPKEIKSHTELRVDRGGTLSPYDELVKKYSEEYGFDWRLITSQMYQESRFDPEARSWVGAQGLLQVMPRTAAELGFDDVVEPEKGIHAGVKYMDWVRERFETELSVQDRTWFTLASYNAGFGHVLDARRLAEQQGWDGDKWFGNTERAMLLLSKPQYARKARYGYVRGAEPVKYVREIRDRYDAYVRATDSQEVAAP